MAIETIFCDLGGVILNFSHEQMFKDVASYLEIEPDIVKKHLNIGNLGGKYERGEISSEELFTFFSSLTPKTIQLEDLMLATSKMFSLKEEMPPFLKSLKNQGLQLILISNTCEPHIRHVKKTYSFLDLFDHLILSYEVKAVKPQLAIYEKALQTAKTSPKNCFYIDDVKEYVNAAESLGIQSHQFQSLDSLVKALDEVL